MQDTSSINAAFSTKGYAVVENVLGEADLRDVETAVGAWAARQMEDWTGRKVQTADYQTAFYAAWQAAGGPEFRRSPLRNLTQPAFYRFLRSDAMLDLAAEILETDDIAVHGIFNARPMLPGAPVTPWHNDAQYWRGHGEPVPELALKRRVVTVWLPLQDLDPELGGLEVASLDTTQRRLFPDDNVDPVTGLLTIAPETSAAFSGEVPMLRRGGCIAFSQLSAHRGTPNRSQRIRWSVDVRYEAAENATVSGRRFGFLARSRSGRYPEESFEVWYARCTGNLTPEGDA